jgi:hypothetical protein
MSDPIRYGRTPENMDLILHKAKSRKDGVYTFRGVMYRVIDNFPRFHACRNISDSTVYETAFGFDVAIGSCGPFECDRRQALKNLDVTTR